MTLVQQRKLDAMKMVMVQGIFGIIMKAYTGKGQESISCMVQEDQCQSIVKVTAICHQESAK